MAIGKRLKKAARFALKWTLITGITGASLTALEKYTGYPGKQIYSRS